MPHNFWTNSICANMPVYVDLPRGSSACLASLRRAAANPEWVDWAAGLPLATTEPLRGDGVSGLTVAVLRVAVEIMPSEGDFGSWLMPAREKWGDNEEQERVCLVLCQAWKRGWFFGGPWHIQSLSSCWVMYLNYWPRGWKSHTNQLCF